MKTIFLIYLDYKKGNAFPIYCVTKKTEAIEDCKKWNSNPNNKDVEKRYEEITLF